MTRKQHLLQISSDPNNKNWANDKSAFGYKMLTKMGWSEGKGLGVNENGMTDYVKTKKNIDNRGKKIKTVLVRLVYLPVGLGHATHPQTDWKSTTEDFNQLLGQLSNQISGT